MRSCIGYALADLEAAPRWAALLMRDGFDVESTGTALQVGIDILVPANQQAAADLVGIVPALAYRRAAGAWRPVPDQRPIVAPRLRPLDRVYSLRAEGAGS